MPDRTIKITDEVAEAICRGAGYEQHATLITISAEDGRLIAEALSFLDAVDEGENTNSDELRRLARLVDSPRWTDPETGYEYATTEQALIMALPAIAEDLDITPSDLEHIRAREDNDRLEPPLGARVEFTRDVDRYPHFSVPAGATGTVTQADREAYTVKLDEPVPGSEAWNGDVIWCPAEGENPAEDIARVNRPAIRAMTDQELRDEIAAGGPAEADHAMREELGKREIAQADEARAITRGEERVVLTKLPDDDPAVIRVRAHDEAGRIFRGEWDANGTITVSIPAGSIGPWLNQRGWACLPNGQWRAPDGHTYWDVEDAIARQLVAEQILIQEAT